MIRVFKGEEQPPAGLATLLPVLVCDLQRDLHPAGPILGVEDAAQALGGDRAEVLGELDRRHIGGAKQGGVCDAVELHTNRGVDLIDAMAVHVAPKRGHAVQVPIALGVHQPAPRRGLHDQRLARPVVLHLCERMPHVGAVGLGERLGPG